MGNCIISGGNNGLVMDLLWTNPNPTSAFEPKTISLNLSNYTCILFVTAQNKSDGKDNFNSYLFPALDIKYNYNNMALSNNVVYVNVRFLKVANDGVTVYNGFYFNSTGSVTTAQPDVSIPRYIYGIK